MRVCAAQAWLAVAAVAVTLALLHTTWRETYGDDGVHRSDDEDGAWLEERLEELRAHLENEDPGLAGQISAVRQVRLLADPSPRKLANNRVATVSGRFTHKTGTLWVGSLDARMRRRTRPAMLMTLLHEAAHAAHGPTLDLTARLPHGNHWGGTWRKLLDHATQRLGWEVEVRCAECTFYGLCEEEQCPACQWAQATCAPYQGGSPSDFARRARQRAGAGA